MKSDISAFIDLLWQKFFSAFTEESILATYFLHKKRSVPLTEAIKEYCSLSNKSNLVRLPEIEIPEKYFAEYAENYNYQVNKISEMSNPQIADMVTLDGICDAYKFAIEVSVAKDGIIDELNINRKRLEEALDRPEYQPNGGPRIHMDAYLQTLQEILQMIEDAEKE